MKSKICFLSVIFLIIQISMPGQIIQNDKARLQILSKTDTIALKQLSQQFEEKYQSNKAAAIKWAKKNGYLIKKTYRDGQGIELQGFKNGFLLIIPPTI